MKITQILFVDKMILVVLVFIIQPKLSSTLGEEDGDLWASSNWPQFDMTNHVPGEPLSPIDYQNAELLINIPPPNTPLSKDPIELAGLFEGDIILTQEQQNRNSTVNEFSEENDESPLKNAVKNEAQKWPSGIIPYFIAAQFSPMERSTIARAFLEYQRQTCIIFKPRTTEPDYVHITKGQGCSSHVGRTGGAQPVILGNGCVYPGIAMHELMHAVGFWHEQSRWDREDHITVNYQNIQPNMEFNFQKYSWNVIQNLGIGYDTSSILHYGAYAFAKDKRYPTIVPKTANSNMGQRNTFSGNDIMKINKLYNCNGQGSGVTPDTQPTTVTTTTEKIPTGDGETSRCLDTHQYCSVWSRQGECQRNPSWMLVNCKLSCNTCNSPCTDSNQLCSLWAQRGECEKNADYMKTYCPKSCGTCSRVTGIADDIPCGDMHVHCEAWAARGECSLNPNYMMQKCRKACKVCEKIDAQAAFSDGSSNDSVKLIQPNSRSIRSRLKPVKRNATKLEL